MDSRGKLVLAVIFLVSAVLVLVHQFLAYGTIFDFDQVLHHETLALFLGALGIGILVGRN